VIQARDIPNLISFARIALVPPIVYVLLAGDFGLALWLFLIAGVSDGLDGFLAKHFAWQSEFGGKLDPAADKLLLLSCYFVLGWIGLLPWWLVGLVFLRDIVIVVGWIAYNQHVQRISAQPMLISKVNTFMQIVLALAVVANQVRPILDAGSMLALLIVVAVTTVWSGVAYVGYWGARVVRHD